MAKLRFCFENVSDLVPIVEGEESQAYRFRSRDKAYIVRLNRSVEGFQKDAFAHRRFARPDLPIPEITHIGEMDHHFFCISEVMPGVTLQDLGSAQLPIVLESTARVLNAIGESELGDMRGFGTFNANGTGEHESWQDFLTSIADNRYHDWAAISHGFHDDEIKVLLERFTGLVEHCPEIRGLVHGDFGSNNVLTDGRNITGVLDWSEALIGDPLYDIANIFFWRTWLDCMHQQARYFEMRLDGLATLRFRLLCYQLRIGLAEIYQNVTKGDMDLAVWALSRCRNLLE